MKRILKSSRVILTGASSGIGRALAKELASQGARLVITARRANELESLAQEIKKEYGTDVYTVVGDITKDEIRNKLLETARLELGGIDILINNAGAGAMIRVEQTPQEVVERLFRLNYFSLFYLTQAAIPDLKKSAQDKEAMKAGRRPIIVNLGSVVGLRNAPHYGVYGSTKAAVGAFSDALRAELASDRIDVLLVCPGTTKTEFFDVLLEDRSRPKTPKHEAVSPAYVAKRIAKAMCQGKHQIVPHFSSKVLDLLNRFCPRFIDWVMAKMA